jgi:D-alanyl-D-alanine carboxypeptidase/D-alanyl-D-alanine-endopeptidase (penicillin-binding protein 4)
MGRSAPATPPTRCRSPTLRRILSLLVLVAGASAGVAVLVASDVGGLVELAGGPGARAEAQPAPAPSAAPRAAAGDRALADELARILRSSGLADRVGVHVVDIDRDVELFGSREALPSNPASNQKLITAATALRVLGPAFRMRTALQGTIGDRGNVALLTLRGGGDPTLTRADLLALAEGLVDRGVRRVARIRIDARYFDDQVDPPAYEQQPREIAPFRAPVSAVAVEGNAFPLRLLPGPRVGALAQVRIPGVSHFAIDNHLRTVADGPPRVIADQRARDDGRLDLRLSGTLPMGILGVTYRRRVEHPRRYAGWVLRDALDRLGIALPNDLTVDLGPAPSGDPILVTRRSPALAVILRELGKDSDNFAAEMLLKVVAAEAAGAPGSTEAGCAQARALLAEAGADLDRVSLVNGSGLFEGNQVPPEVLTRLLTHVYRQPALRPEYLAGLATAGVDGTLVGRLRDLPEGVSVRAKTGTLAAVASLSGYILASPGDDRAWAFSVIANDVRGQIGAARRLADDLVRAMAAAMVSP